MTEKEPNPLSQQPDETWEEYMTRRIELTKNEKPNVDGIAPTGLFKGLGSFILNFLDIFR